MEREINPIAWYGERYLEFTPRHFVITQTEVTTESKMWILNNLQGRYSFIQKKDEFDSLLLMLSDGVPAFEDPKEAVLYELKWG